MLLDKKFFKPPTNGELFVTGAESNNIDNAIVSPIALPNAIIHATTMPCLISFLTTVYIEYVFEFPNDIGPLNMSLRNVFNWLLIREIRVGIIIKESIIVELNIVAPEGAPKIFVTLCKLW